MKLTYKDFRLLQLAIDDAVETAEHSIEYKYDKIEEKTPYNREKRSLIKELHALSEKLSKIEKRKNETA